MACHMSLGASAIDLTSVITVSLSCASVRSTRACWISGISGISGEGVRDGVCNPDVDGSDAAGGSRILIGAPPIKPQHCCR